MSDPKRLLDGGGDDVEVLLLRSAKRDVPSARARQKTLAAMGLGTGVATATVTATAAGGSAAAKLGAWSVVKWVGIGVLGGAATVGVVESTSRPRPPTAPSAVTVASQWAAPLPTPLQLPRPVADVAASASAAVQEPMRPTVSTSAASAGPDQSLTAEVEALERAREALSSGNPRVASAELDAYEHQFPRGMMGPEATVLRIETMNAAGHRAGARAVAERFLAAHPSSAHASRVRSLVGLPSIP